MSEILCKILCPVVLVIAFLFNTVGNWAGVGDIIPTENCPFGGDCCSTTATETTSGGCSCTCGCHGTMVTDITTTPNSTSAHNSSGPTQPTGADEDPLAAVNVKQLITSQEFAGYRWSPEGQYYYTDDKECWQGNANYNTVYDQMTPLTAMFIDCMRIKFNYGGQDWMIQFWKGQYGWLLLGAEIGVFVAEERTTQFLTESSVIPVTEPATEGLTNEPAIEPITAEINTEPFTESVITDINTEPTNERTTSADLSNYYCATQEDWLYMQLDCYYAEKGQGAYERLFSRPYAKYWWSTGFVKGQITKYTAPRNELKVKARITFKDAEMADAFVTSLENAGFRRGASNAISQMTDDTYYIEGADVWIFWSNIYQSAF